MITTQIRPDLAGAISQIDLDGARRDLMAIRTNVLPVARVDDRGGTIHKLRLSSGASAQAAVRADGTTYKQRQSEMETDNYRCLNYGVESPIDEKQIAEFRNILSLEIMEAQVNDADRIRRALIRNVGILLNRTTWPVGTATGADVGTPWSTSASATPVTDVANAIQQLNVNLGGSGQNWLFCSEACARRAWATAQVRTTIGVANSGASPGDSRLDLPALARALGLDGIVAISGSYAETPGDTTLTAITSNALGLVYRPARAGLIPNVVNAPGLGLTMAWTGGAADGQIRSRNEGGINSVVIRAEEDVHEKVLFTQAGYLLGNLGA